MFGLTVKLHFIYESTRESCQIVRRASKNWLMGTGKRGGGGGGIVCERKRRLFGLIGGGEQVVGSCNEALERRFQLVRRNCIWVFFASWRQTT